MSITLAQIRMALPTFTEKELTELNSELCDIIKHKRASASHEAIQNFSVGDKVSYEDKGQQRTGIVVKINRTRIVVKPDHTPHNHKVSGSAYMFTKCEPAFDPTTGAWN